MASFLVQGRNLRKEFEGLGGVEGRRRVGSIWNNPSPGPGVCTDSTYQNNFQLQYRQKGQGHKQGGEGVRGAGRGGEGRRGGGWASVGDSGSLVS